MPLPPATPIADLPNLGPVTARWLAEVDVHTYGDLAALGAVEAYARLRFRHGSRVTRNALFAIEATIRGLDWRHLAADVKAEVDAAAALRLTAFEAPPSA